MLAPMPLSPDAREWLRKLGRDALAKLVVAAATAVGTKLGEAAVEALLRRAPDEDDGDTDEPGDE